MVKIPKCPNCMKQLSRDEISFWVRKDSEFSDVEFEDPVLKKICGEKEKNGDKKYRRFWEKENTVIAEEGKNRIVVNGEEIREILTAMEDGTDKLFRADGMLPRFFLENEVETVAEVIPVCGKCHNIIREDFFAVNSFHIGMIAPKETGKTSFLCGLSEESILRSEGMFGYTFAFDYIQEENPVFREFHEQLEEHYLEGKSLKGSENIRRFPISVTVKRKNGDGSEDTFRLIFHDVSGELYQTPGLFIRNRIAQMDALICMAEVPDTGPENYNNKEEIWQKYLDSCEVLPMEKQVLLQSQKERKEQYIYQLLPQIKSKITDRKNDSIYRAVTEGNPMLNLPENQIPMAFLLTKGDRLRKLSFEKINALMQEDRDWEVFYTTNSKEGNTLQKKKRFSKRMLEMLAPSLYHFSQKYGKTVYGIVSAYGKEPDGTQPAPWGIQESLVLLLDKMLS